MLIHGNLFKPQADPENQKRLFADMVELVEVEVHSFCNRACWFCPNSFIDRNSGVKLLDENVYRRLLSDLGRIGYSGQISYSRYNEPFAHESFFESLKQAAVEVPLAKLITNTNGDYLDFDVMSKAERAGLRELNIQIYFERIDVITTKLLTIRKEEIRKKFGFIDFASTGKDSLTGRHKDMKVNVVCHNFTKQGVDRCDLSVRNHPVKRLCPCYLPLSKVYIDYTGYVVPCCNIRSDYEKHTPFILGRLEDVEGSLFRIFSGDRASKWRRKLAVFGDKKYPCKHCTFAMTKSTPESREKSKEIAQQFGKE